MATNSKSRGTRRAVIVGGSMSGLFSAAFLRKIGWEVDVYERSSVELVSRGAGITGHPELFDALEASGAGTKPEARDWTAGITVYDISEPAKPRQIGFMNIKGGGAHRIWFTGGRWAYISALLDGFSDYIFTTVDMADPTHPREPGRY